MLIVLVLVHALTPGLAFLSSLRLKLIEAACGRDTNTGCGRPSRSSENAVGQLRESAI